MTCCATRRIAVLVLEGSEAIDVVGPFEIFAAATRLLAQLRPDDPPAYAIDIVAARRGPLRAASGLALCADRATRDPISDIDTLVVTGSLDFDTRTIPAATLRWVKRQADRSRRVVSICTGAFVLAEAGLLDGRRATTHWLKADALAARYPNTEVQADAIFVCDGNTWSSAGATAGMDLTLSLVEQDFGRETARTVAQLLVMFVHRPGGQSQFSAALMHPPAEDQRLRQVQTFIEEHPEADLRVPALAGRAGMSPRNFARVFKVRVGCSIGGYVTTVRIGAAKRLLEDPGLQLEQVAAQTGFGSAETMRRAFWRATGVSPSGYRERFCRLDMP